MQIFLSYLIFYIHFYFSVSIRKPIGEKGFFFSLHDKWCFELEDSEGWLQERERRRAYTLLRAANVFVLVCLLMISFYYRQRVDGTSGWGYWNKILPWHPKESLNPRRRRRGRALTIGNAFCIKLKCTVRPADRFSVPVRSEVWGSRIQAQGTCGLFKFHMFHSVSPSSTRMLFLRSTYLLYY